MSIRLGNERFLNITASRSGGERDTIFYVQSLKVNGKEWDKSWVAWNDVFAKGATMEYVMGESPSNWPGVKSPPPPSPGSDGT